MSDQEKQAHTDPEYVLKGVQAFGIGVALFAASVAVAHTAIAQFESGLPLVIKVVTFSIFLLLNIVISAFGCMAVLLSGSMTGLFEVKKPIKIIDWALSASWIAIAFAISGMV